MLTDFIIWNVLTSQTWDTTVRRTGQAVVTEFRGAEALADNTLVIAGAWVSIIAGAFENWMVAYAARSAQVVSAGIVIGTALRLADALAHCTLVCKGAVIAVIASEKAVDWSIHAAAHRRETAIIRAGVFVITL